MTMPPSGPTGTASASDIHPADYAFKLTAQQWPDDPYFVASSAPVKKITVVAATQAEAFTEAVRVLGPSDSDRYWRFWVDSVVDVRLPEAATSD